MPPTLHLLQEEDLCYIKKHLKKVTIVYQEMQEKEIKMNIILYTTLIKAYSKGKSRIRGWGKQKIVQRLTFELGQDFDSEMHLEGVDEEAAQKKLVRDLGKKREILLKKQDKDLKTKLLNFCISRGFLFEESLKILQTEFGL